MDKHLQEVDQKINQVQKTVTYMVNVNQRSTSNISNIVNIFIVVFFLGVFEAGLFYMFKK